MCPLFFGEVGCGGGKFGFFKLLIAEHVQQM